MKSKCICALVFAFTLLFSGCIGQKALPTETTVPPTLPPTIVAPATSPPTAPQTTLPPTSTPAITSAPKEEVVHYKDFVGVPEDSEIGQLFKLFMKELKDEDGSDYEFSKAFIPVKSARIDAKNWMAFYSGFQVLPYSEPRLKSLDKIDMNALNQIKEFDPEIKKAILYYMNKYRDNDIIFLMKRMDGGPCTLYIGTDLLTYNVDENDPDCILTRLDCHLWTSRACTSVTLPWQEAAFYFVVSKESADAFWKHFGIPI